MVQAIELARKNPRSANRSHARENCQASMWHPQQRRWSSTPNNNNPVALPTAHSAGRCCCLLPTHPLRKKEVLLLYIMGNCIITPPSQVAVISGPGKSRMVIGQCAFQKWFIERVEILSLELITLTVKSTEAETVRGVRVTVSGTCQVKVDAFTQQDLAQNLPQITLACQHFLGKTEDQVHQALLRTLEGHQRQILGTLTVEELYKDRAAFSQRVREHIQEDLNNMGFALVSYTVNQVLDSQGYMEALGATQTALVKREAAEGESKNISEAKKRVAENESSANMAEATYRAEAHVGVAMEDEKRAAADRDLAIKKAAYKAEVNHAEATAAVAFDIEKARQGQTVVREQTKQRAEEALVMLDVQGTEALTMQKQKEGVSKAMLIEEKNKAEAIRAKADAKAHEINQVGLAEASAILAKGEAESKVLELRGDSFQHFGNAAIVQSIVDRLPDIAREIAAPLAKTDKMVFIAGEGGGAGSRLTQDVGSILAQLPETVEALTGVDITKGLDRMVGSGGGGTGTSNGHMDPKLAALLGAAAAKQRSQPVTTGDH
ncbi:unnamed protein product [Ectocarpus sp. 12 AP-2014]